MNERGATRPRPLLSRRFWVGLLLGAGVVLTSLTGLVVGWLAINFQIGNSGSPDDYRVGAGGYGAAALILALGAVAVWTWGAPTWELVWALGSASVLAVLCFGALSDAAHAGPGPGYNGWLDGAGGVIACPWAWPLVVLGAWGPARVWLRR